MRLRMPALPALLLLCGAAQPGLSDIDVGEIRAAAAAYIPGTPLQYLPRPPQCGQHFDSKASDEVDAAIQTDSGIRHLIVSRIGGHWEVGGRQRRELQRQVLWATEQQALASIHGDRELYVQTLRGFSDQFKALDDEDRLDGVPKPGRAAQSCAVR